MRVLGAVEAAGPDGEIALSGVRLRGLLARLALDAARPVGAATLVADLWADPPDNAANALQALVSRLRRALGADRVVTVGGGYRLAVAPDAVDALCFDRLVTDAAGGDPAGAHALLGEALALWRGPALDGLAELPFAAAATARLAGRRAAATEDRATAALRLGLPADLDALAAQLAGEPLRETTAVVLARALHAAGRQADALATLDSTVAALADQLGVDPGPELAATRLSVLRGPAPRPPSGLTSFVGRDADVARITALLDAGRLVTLVGPGGAGKTRLAREATGGTAIVAELAALTAADQLAPAVLAAVGEPELMTLHRDEPPPDAASRLRAALERRDTLLLLDNCEHLVDGVAKLVAGLLDDCPRLRVLATSREALAVPGETLHPVEALPDGDAMRLFAERAAAVRPGFTLDGVADVVGDICRRLDGQPLPIELAAARLRTLTPAEIAARLDDRFRLLTSGPRTAAGRHQTLRAVVDWSWDLLDEPERAVARRLGAFAGGATLAAAERVCGPDAFERLTSLVDKSLVVAVPQPDASTRYRMLETIRAYAGERLDEAGERAAAEIAHAAFVVEFVEEAEPHIRTREQLRWLARLQAEAEEIDLALRRTAAADVPAAYRIVTAMTWSWLIRGRIDEGRRWLAALPAAGTDVDPAVAALAEAYRALATVSAGEVTAGNAHAVAAAERLTSVTPPWHPVLQLVGPVRAVFADRDDTPVRRLLTDTDDAWVRAVALQCLAARAENDGRLDEQRTLVRRAHAEFSALGERFGLGMVVYTLGELEGLAGQHDAAAAAFDEAIALAAELGNEEDMHQFVAGRALVEARRGDLAAARTLLHRAAALPQAWPAGAMVAASWAQVERMAGNLDAARAHLAVVEQALAVDPDGIAILQRNAYLDVQRAQIELVAGDIAAARDRLRAAGAAAAGSQDGPVVAYVAEAAAQLAHAEGDTGTAFDLLALAAARRGTLDRGSPDVVALLAALGPDAERRLSGTAVRDTVLAEFLAR